MFRIILATTALAGLVACGDGNPFDNPLSGGGGGTVGDTDSVLTGADLNEDLTANSVTYNDQGTPSTADDTLVINNLPFDNSDLSGGVYSQVSTLATGFELYESTLSSSGRQYFAVFQRSAEADATAVATDDYFDFGFGGTVVERRGAGGVPAARPTTYTFTGDYAGLRVYRDDGFFLTNVVDGDAILYVDILDFDVNGAVEGIIVNRDAYALNGVFVADIPDGIVLATASVDFDNARIEQSDASLQAGENLGDGSWEGIFAGSGGAEIAGIVVIEGSPSEAEIDARGFPTGARVRENGVFIVLNGG